MKLLFISAQLHTSEVVVGFCSLFLTDKFTGSLLAMRIECLIFDIFQIIPNKCLLDFIKYKKDLGRMFFIGEI